MHQVLILGAGKIGSLLACMLAESGNYEIVLADLNFSTHDSMHLQDMEHVEMVSVDVTDAAALNALAVKYSLEAVVASLPYFLNIPVAEFARKANLHYFDLTEDVDVAKQISELAMGAEKAFVPQCGLAPGYVGILANDLMQQFDELHTARLRVGALPLHSNNVLHYALTWSTDGLINEYGNECFGIQGGMPVTLQPLEDLETIAIDGLSYEAFNTSGGLGNLAEIYAGKIRALNYKTIRYPGHCEKMRFLMKDLKLNDDRKTLRQLLENILPKVSQDVVTIYVSVAGTKNGEAIERSIVKKIYPQTIANHPWAAIQATTAAGVCSVLDLVLSNPEQYHGLIYQEKFTLDDVHNSQFGKIFTNVI